MNHFKQKAASKIGLYQNKNAVQNIVYFCIFCTLHGRAKGVFVHEREKNPGCRTVWRGVQRT